MHSVRVYSFMVTSLITLAFVAGCRPDETAGNTDEQESSGVALRGDATLHLQPGTSIDEDELDSRGGYGATLTDTLGMAWFVRVEASPSEALDALGLTPVALTGAHVLAGAVPDETGRDCRVYIPVAAGRSVVVSRPSAPGGHCPTTSDELSPWVPDVTVTGAHEGDIGTAEQALVFGTYVGTYNGVNAYSNGSTSYVSGTYSCCGLQWQCVEYVNRYYVTALGHQNLKGTGNAKDYYGTASSKGLSAYANGGAVKPAVGDMLASGAGAYGHIAIIREVGANYIKVIHQNWSNDLTDNSKTISMTVSNGFYTVSGFSTSYTVQGWLRRPPTVSTVTPSSAMLNQLTTFTVNGSYLPSTLAPWIAECAGLQTTSVTATHATFTCTPSYTTGVKSGVIKSKSGGTVLKNFSVSVQ